MHLLYSQTVHTQVCTHTDLYKRYLPPLLRFKSHFPRQFSAFVKNFPRRSTFLSLKREALQGIRVHNTSDSYELKSQVSAKETDLLNSYSIRFPHKWLWGGLAPFHQASDDHFRLPFFAVNCYTSTSLEHPVSMSRKPVQGPSFGILASALSLSPLESSPLILTVQITFNACLMNATSI